MSSSTTLPSSGTDNPATSNNNNPNTTTTTTTTSTMTPGVAGRINYAQWDKVASDLVQEVEQQDAADEAKDKALLGLDGKYARSHAEAQEREKAQAIQKTKQALENYKKRESSMMMSLEGLLGPVNDEMTTTNTEESKATDPRTVRITRDRMDAGTRVVTLSDTSGNSLQDTIVLTQDLSLLESKMAANAMGQAKSYPSDAENDAPSHVSQERSIYGVIKIFVSNVHNCTVLIKCKVISGTLEIHNCSNVRIIVTSDATVATVQADLSENLQLEFQDAPSGKNTALPGQSDKHKLYWGDDADDRIFHAGVKNMKVKLIRDDFVETEIVADYLKDGATAIGNATPEEFQFITSVVNGQLVTEKVVRSGSTTGKNARAMTERELEEEKKRRERAADLAVAMAEDMIQIKDKDGNVLAKKTDVNVETVSNKEEEEDVVEEVYASMTKEQIQDIVDECEQNKARGNEAFGAGEYGQAILLYSLALDKTDELPDKDSDKKLFPRDVLYSNRAACFLKLGQHEKAQADAEKALEFNPDNIKANFRRGLALHAMGKYMEALPVLAKAHKIEPHNKQIKQALQFCEVRLAQEQRKRMS